MNGTFYDRLGSVAEVFEQWGTCEQTLVACAIARRVPWPGLRLVQRTVEAALESHAEDERLGQDANDETLLATLLVARDSDDDEDDMYGERLCKLLTLLPLLRTDNERAKNVYMGAVPALVQRCVDAPRQTIAPDLCRQLLSYLLVHPALSLHDQSTMTQWLRYLENHISGNRTPESVWQQRLDLCLLPETNIWNTSDTFRRTIGKNVEFRGILDAEFLQESFSKNGRDVDVSGEGDLVDPAVAQLKPQRSNSLTPPAESLGDEPFVKPRSFSLSSEPGRGQPRPAGAMLGTTGSETRLDRLRGRGACAAHPGMAAVAQWLKALRLHKYAWLFANVSYERMLDMDDKYLERLGVTKGARHKLLLSIKKLSERGSLLEGVQAELAAGGPGSLVRALEQLRGVLLSPMPPASDLPQALVAALELASECLSSASSGSSADGDDHLDPMSLHCWLVEKALHHESFRSERLQGALRRLRHRLPPRQFFQLVSDMPTHRRPKPRWRAGAAGRGRRWPPPPPPPPPDDYSRLDALCLQVAQQAID